jgi:hypothetical protein
MTGLEVMLNPLVRYAPTLAIRHLSVYVRGDEVWCQGFSEPDAGSDLAALRCRADRTRSGLRINGQKVWASFSASSSRCLLLARTGQPGDGNRGLSMILVDMSRPGVVMVPTVAATGRDEFGELFFDDVEVDLENVVGEIGQGWEIAMYLLQWERGMYAWQRQGFLHSQLMEIVAATRPANRAGSGERVGRAYLALNRLRFSAFHTVNLLSAGKMPAETISVDKLLLANAEQLVFDLVRDLLPEKLVLDDEPAARQLRSDFLFSRAASVYGGTAEIQRNIIAERILRLPRDAR